MLDAHHAPEDRTIVATVNNTVGVVRRASPGKRAVQVASVTSCQHCGLAALS